MFGMSASHLLILGIVVLLFGARRLPELGAALGQTVRQFKKAVDGSFDDQAQPEKLADSSSEKPSDQA